jgi:hypothetical protein
LKGLAMPSLWATAPEHLLIPKGQTMQTETTEDIRLKHIGTLDHGIDGQDIYYLLTRLDDDLSPAEAEDYLAPRFRWGSEDDHPNLITCRAIDATQAPYSDNECICIVRLTQNN